MVPHRWTCVVVLAIACSAEPNGAHAGQQVPRVVLVQPSAASVPANILRISIEFAAPIDGPVLSRLALRRADGSLVPEPFLQQELWSPNGKILTILMHPGRVKTGLLAREALGPILTDGEELSLTLDGRPIRRWKVTSADTHGPVAAAWKLSPVRAASRQALVVTLDGPIDGRDAGYLAVLDRHGRQVTGRARLQDGESRWIFTPARPWRAGRYSLVAAGSLEDSAGNRLGSQFETPANSTRGPAVDATLAFSVPGMVKPR
jgi:hypothetical protein